MTDAELTHLSPGLAQRSGSVRIGVCGDLHDDGWGGADGYCPDADGFGASGSFGTRGSALLGSGGFSRSDPGSRKLGAEPGGRPLQQHSAGARCPSGLVCQAAEDPTGGSGRRPAARGAFHHHIPDRLTPRAALAAAAFAVVGLWTAPASAQTQYSAVCGVTGNATAPTRITYDPFSPTGLSQATIPLVLQRTRNLLLGRTDQVSLILVAPTDAPPLTITYQGQNVLYREGSAAGWPRGIGGNFPGEIRYQFGGVFSSDLSVPLDLRVSVPPGSDLTAGEPIYLDIVFICSAEGLMLPVLLPTRVNRAIRLDVNVVSALQAYYAGSTLDFGEIGDVTTQQVQANPDQYTTAATNSLRVRSSGPYQVQVRSQNDFRLTYPGGSTGNPAQTIRYSVRFLGEDIASNGGFGTRTCEGAGVGGAAGMLPIRARLSEGGASKTPSPNYRDTITVTFTPVVTASAAQPCAGL